MRYRHLRRTVIAVLAAVAFVLLIGLMVQKVLDSTLFRRAALRWIEGAAATRGFDLNIAQAEWDILPPRAVLRDRWAWFWHALVRSPPWNSARSDHRESHALAIVCQ